ncbi:glycosyltransferase [Fimbriimonas ginsengisoli]|uniref:Bacteriophage N4 adsorption protein B n=1 Tax=Fimbriimonas ginsengisoli Gsoil 348 TaxID=661478 RepID=A0A068NTI6_FIMGI|nr:glycosyltransferase [Fimbriimonas ginsengisoli]AIE86657.1 Bacteriophage N4 adsorption protein B [Fimbriimonas ginsengisoli Gsoil 348]
MNLQARDLLIILRDVFAGMTWVVSVIYFLSGSQDLVYDIGAYWLRFWRLYSYRRQPRLSLERLRARDQQRIAVMVPAWNEGEVVASMVDNIIKRVEYENYSIFVGTYPNDPATQACVDRLAKEYPQINKVVTLRPGPTTKADCLHNVLKTIRAHEEAYGVNFDIILMHDAEDWVHPQSFLLHNYLIPQVDVVQLPILPLPTKWNKWVHWIYADEFSENHLKDVPVREKISGFVPYAGTGTGFSRKVIDFLSDEHGGHVFNESSMTEDYSMSKKIREAGLRSVFVTVVLEDDKSPWWTPLCKRPMFISNWSYFPMDWTRSVRQKSRWIIGISLQEWEQSGWEGNWLMKENFVKDRKVFVAASASFLGYFILLYFVLYAMGQAGWIPFRLLSILVPGTALAHLVAFCSFFMILRVTQRITWVSLTYGLGPGILSVPRLIIGNILNGLATFRALKVFADSRSGKAAVRWDNTQHLEGVGGLHGEDVKRDTSASDEHPLEEVLAGLASEDPLEMVKAMRHVPASIGELERAEVVAYLRGQVSSNELRVRAALAQTLGRLQWPEVTPTLFRLLNDPDSVVRLNAARALLQRPKVGALLEQAFTAAGPKTIDALIRVLEQDRRRQREVFDLVDREGLAVTKATIMVESPILRKRYATYLEEMAGDPSNANQA